MNRNDHLERLANETFDLCIIGGGASGAGCALDAALRGLKVALVERGDFAGATSSKSTKLIHGGVRYLEMAFKNLDFAQLKQVKHGLEERNILLKNAPHLSHPIALITPVFSWWEGLYYTIGLKLYDWMSGRNRRLMPGRWLSKAETLRAIPGISDRVHSAVMYYDGQMNDARYALAIIKHAAKEGAAVANYTRLDSFERDPRTGQLLAANVSDTLGQHPFQIKARVFLNCTGPFADHVRQMANPEIAPCIRASKGAHLVLAPGALQSQHALLIPKTRDGRIIFALPFGPSFLVGTTDEPFNDTSKEPFLEEQDVDFLLDTLRPYFNEAPQKEAVSGGFAGLRPLLQPAVGRQQTGTKTMLRDHVIEQDTASGLISLMGGKWTTYRLMASDATDLVCRHLGLEKTCLTADYRLCDDPFPEPDRYIARGIESGLPADICTYLYDHYGPEMQGIIDRCNQDPALRTRLIPGEPYILGEVACAVATEMACTLSDVLSRRIRLDITNWTKALEAAPAVAEYMAGALFWTPEYRAQQLKAYSEHIQTIAQRAGIYPV